MYAGISQPRFYGDLVYKFKRVIEKPIFSDLFKKIIKRFERFDITGVCLLDLFCSCVQFYVLIYACSPFYILIYMFWGMNDARIS